METDAATVALARDGVQETFLGAHRQLGRFESRANFGTPAPHRGELRN